MPESHAQIFPVRIDWGDLDLLGHVNNIAISRYFQAARVEYCANIGMKVFPGMPTGPILAASKIQFTAQLYFPGEVRIFTRVKKAGHTSVVLEHALLDAQGALAAFGEDVIVRFDFKAKTKIPLGEEVTAALAAYEKSLDGAFPTIPAQPGA